MKTFRRSGWYALLATALLTLAAGLVPAPGFATPNGVWSELGPPARNSHGAIYDPLRDRMLVVGGVGSDGTSRRNEVWELTLTPGAAWHPLSVAGTPPAPREGLSAIYDPVRDRVLIFGGGDANGVMNDVWALTLGSSPAWAQLATSGSPPPARYRQAMIYDPVRDRLVVFAGDAATFPSSPYRNDVWALSLGGAPTWSHLLPTGTLPKARSGPSAVYDPTGDRMIVWGGEDDNNSYNDTWSLSLGASPAWTKLTPSGTAPDGRNGSGTMYDPVRQRMILFGGSGTYNDTWSLSLGGPLAWTHLAPSGGPPHGRTWSSAVYDATRDRLLLYGGTGYEPGDDVWALTLDASPAWTLILQPVRPGQRSNHSAILDAARNRMIVYGGTNGISGYPDVWALDLGTVPVWHQLATTGGGGPVPNGRYWHVSICDPIGDRMIVFGGSSLGDMWQLSLSDPPTWTQIVIPGGPGARYRPAAAYDPIGHRMIVFGGTFNGTNFGDTWALNLDGALSWSAIPGATHPSARSGAKMVFDPVNSRMLCMGADNNQTTNPPLDCWALSLGATPAWSQLATGGATPGMRMQHSMAFDAPRSRVLLDGGSGYQGGNSYGPLDDTQSLDVSGSPTWSALIPSSTTPGGRLDGSVLYDSDLDRMVLFNGIDTWFLNFADAPPPAPASLLDASRQPGHIEVEWQGREVSRPSGHLYRRAAGGSWTSLGTLTPDASNRLSYDDAAVDDATAYQYTVGFAASPGEQYAETASLGGGTTAVGPAVVSLAIRSAHFGDQGLEVNFSLASAAPARLDLFDLAGRRVGSADLAGRAAGAQSTTLGSRSLASGLYWLRLTQAGESRLARAVRIR